MRRTATYRLMVTRREMLYVHDEFGHSLVLVETEGEPIEYQVGVAGEFVSRRGGHVRLCNHHFSRRRGLYQV